MQLVSHGSHVRVIVTRYHGLNGAVNPYTVTKISGEKRPRNFRRFAGVTVNSSNLMSCNLQFKEYRNIFNVSAMMDDVESHRFIRGHNGAVFLFISYFNLRT